MLVRENLITSTPRSQSFVLPRSDDEGERERERERDATQIRVGRGPGTEETIKKKDQEAINNVRAMRRHVGGIKGL